MAILACILPVVTFLCQPVLGAFRTSVGNLSESVFGFLKDRVGSLFVRCWENPAEEVPEPDSEVVGAEETLNEIRNHLQDDSVGIIGIHGMGGVGKTTILQVINNEFFEPGRQCPFDLVVWITVSQTVSIPEIQKQIADRLSLSLSESNTEKNARVLSKALSNKRFLMLLDDIWEAIDLRAKIGIPNLRRRRRPSTSKIAFTTRLSQVCSDMGADKIVLVKCLDKASSWQLFCSKLYTEEVIRRNPTIRWLAEQVVDKCGGLPLALITVGRAMANREDIQDWEDAVNALDYRPERLEGMDDQVLSCLKFSYDYLKNDNIRSALLFCAMYPEDAEINRKELIEHWIGEGLVDDENDAGEGSIDDARGAGQTLINKLRDACLLEPGTESSTVRMHDAVRDMALWLNRHPGHEKVDGFLVKDIFTTTNVVTGTKGGREHIKRIWVRSGELEEEMFNPDRSANNRTLLLNNVIGLWPSILRTIASSMKGTLRVLNLSGSNLKVLPSEVGLMTELHYLNLSSTGIRLLPEKLGELIKLRQLLLNDMYYLQEIPRQAIAGLWSLQVLTMWGTVYDWEDDPRGHGCRQLEVGDLEAYLPRLEELHIQLGTPRALERFLTSHKLCRCTRGLCLAKLKRQGDRSQSEEPLYGEGGSLLRVFSAMGSSLKRLDLQGDDAHPWDGGLRISLDQLPLLEDLCLSSFKSEKMPEVVLVGSNINPGSSNVRLSTFTMRRCDGQKVLKLVGAFPCLQVFILRDCSTMEELVMDDDAVAADIGGGTPDDTGLLDSHFPMLREIHLLSLPALMSMGGNRPLRLPALRSIKAIGCPELTRLPVDAAGVPKLKIVRGERKWGGTPWTVMAAGP